MSLPTELFTNASMLWGGLIAESFARLGGEHGVLSPGSRSAPLTLGFARHPQLSKHVLLDERSAGFFALGLAKRTGKPVALIGTSGTAVVNFMPAIVEASESGVPLLVLTADRPPELRHCHAGQTIDQVKLYGNYPLWQAELAVPEVSVPMLDYVRQMIAQGFARAIEGAGVVHLNVPFREPLHPKILPMPDFIQGEDWFERWVAPLNQPVNLSPRMSDEVLKPVRAALSSHHRGLIVIGDVAPSDVSVYAAQIKALAQKLGWPILDGGFSGLRQFSRELPHLIAHYEPLLMNESFVERMQPECVLTLGTLPTSKRLRAWLSKVRPKIIALNATLDNCDPLHLATSVRGCVEQLLEGWEVASPSSAYADMWMRAHRLVTAKLELLMVSDKAVCEPHVGWLLSRNMPEGAQVMVANSMPVRDVEFFWRTGKPGHRMFVSRGANGIDGTLSTALGIAESAACPTYLLTGDLAFLHDVNGLLHASKLNGSLTVVLINNRGGGIFEHLPIAQSKDVFETYFATPQSVDYALLAQAHGVAYTRCEDAEVLVRGIAHPPERGLQILEIPTDRKADTAYRKEILHALSRAV